MEILYNKNMVEKFDVIVIGGGVAGLQISKLLSQAKLNACLIDAKPDLLKLNFYTLGSYLNLKEYGLTTKVIASQLSEVVVHSQHLSLKKNCQAYILDKYQLHKELLTQIQANGVTIKTGTRVTSFTTHPNGEMNQVIDSQGKSHQARIFVDATGVSGVISRAIGLQDKILKVATGLEYDVQYLGSPSQAHLFIGKDIKGSYGWIFPTGNQRAILGLGAINQQTKSNLKQKLDSLFNYPSIKSLINKDRKELYGGSIPITDVKKQIVYKNIVAIGDSISQVHPLIGEGYRFILRTGQIAAPYIIKAIKTKDINKLTGYEQEWTQTFYQQYKIAKSIRNIMETVTCSDLATNLTSLWISCPKYQAIANELTVRISWRKLLI